MRPRLLLVLLAAAALALPLAAGATTRTLTITAAIAHPVHPFKAFDGDPPRTFDFNGDGRQEIIAQNDNQYAYVFDSRTGASLAEVTTTFPPGWGARSFNGPEAYTEGGVAHLVLENSAAYVTSFRFDKAASTATHFVFAKEWERHLDTCHASPGSDAKPVLVDLDRDGHYEIVASTEEVGVYALRADSGALYWKACIGGGNAEPEVGDLNRDGFPDVVFGSDGGIVTAMNGRTGQTMWAYNILAHFNLGSASMPVGPAIGQLDGLGGPDVVVGARDSHNATDPSKDHAMLLALSSGGTLLWARQDVNGGAPLTYTHPIIADAASDGQPEVYWADWNTMGHKPPWDESQAWQVTGPAHFYRYDKAGGLVWKQTLSTFWNNKDLALADVDHDGVQEVLATGPNSAGHEGIWYLDSRTGAQESFVDVYPWQVERGPVVADLGGTGTMQWILEAGPQATSAGPAIQVYDTGVPYNAMWPHVPEYPLGAPVPTTSTSATTTTALPPQGGCFAATFTIKAPNEWWQELSPHPADGRPVHAADVRVNGGSWQPMAMSSWGAWTSSVHSVAGSHVEFRIHDATTGTSQSQPFTWMDGTLSKPSAPCGGTTTSSTTGGGTFAATFTPHAVGNDWWVETAVDSTHAIAKVEAKLGGGAWQPLDATSWGTWAKSLPAPNGTPVTFRATDTAGATATSQVYVWT
jgi:hypothetical protein